MGRWKRRKMRWWSWNSCTKPELDKQGLYCLANKKRRKLVIEKNKMYRNYKAKLKKEGKLVLCIMKTQID